MSKKVSVKFNEGDIVYLTAWDSDDSSDTYRVLSFFESPKFGPSAHLRAVSGVRVGQYRSVPLVNLQKPARLIHRGRGKWVVITPEGEESVFATKAQAQAGSRKKGLLIKE